MVKKILTTPMKAEDLEDIRIGDIIYLSGRITTRRDVAHRRPIEGGRKLPVDLEDGAILYAGSVMRPLEGGRYEMVSVGLTTGMRMEKFERGFIRETGVCLVVGKEGVGVGAEEGCKEHKALCYVFPADCAVMAADSVEEVEQAQWPDLGMPETLWICRVKEFGPPIVSIDTYGRNLFEQNKVEFNEKKDKAYERTRREIYFIK